MLIVDLELDCDDDLLVEIFFIDLLMILLLWLFDVEASIFFLGSVFTCIILLLIGRFIIFFIRLLSFFNSFLLVIFRKGILIVVKRNGYVTNEVVFKGKVFFLSFLLWEVEFNVLV